MIIFLRNFVIEEYYMANGNGTGIPGFFVAGGIGVSNTAILIGGLAIATALWISSANANSQRREFSDGTNIQRVVDDVYAYAASPSQVASNSDRVRAAVQRSRTAVRIALDAYKKKKSDLRIALRNGTITRDQYKVQRRAALFEFHAAIRTRWQEIHDALGVATRNPHSDTVVPTVP